MNMNPRAKTHRKLQVKMARVLKERKSASFRLEMIQRDELSWLREVPRENHLHGLWV